jgi:hypothetical protein
MRFATEPHPVTLPVPAANAARTVRIQLLGNSESVRSPNDSVPFQSLIDAWAIEKKAGKESQKDFEAKVSRLTTFLGHSDAARLTDTDFIGWKDYMVQSGPSDKTISNHLNVIKIILNYGVANKKLTVNRQTVFGSPSRKMVATHDSHSLPTNNA